MKIREEYSDSPSTGFFYYFIILGLILLALILGGRLLFTYLGDVNRFPVNHIKVAATYDHISHNDVENALKDYLDYSFFLLPVNQLQRKLSALPWVDQVAIERVWPDMVKITVIEKKPVAQWGNDLMMADGSLLPKEADFPETGLPVLYGPENQQQEVLHVFEKLSKMLTEYGLHASGLQLRDNQAWELVLTNGVLLRLGKKDFELRLERFCRAYSTVFEDRASQLASVDLRYPRGMAVLWKQETGK